MTATTPRSRKSKGKSFQNILREDIIALLHIREVDILSTVMGMPGCDLYLSHEARKVFPFGVEAKCQNNISFPAWWEQCVTNAIKENLKPLLVFRRTVIGKRNNPTIVCLYWTDFLAILSENKRLKETIEKR